MREARIVRNPRTGESRGFGFVMMDGEEDVDQVGPSTDCLQHDPQSVLGSVASAMWQAVRAIPLRKASFADVGGNSAFTLAPVNAQLCSVSRLGSCIL